MCMRAQLAPSVRVRALFLSLSRSLAFSDSHSSPSVRPSLYLSLSHAPSPCRWLSLPRTLPRAPPPPTEAAFFGMQIGCLFVLNQIQIRIEGRAEKPDDAKEHIRKITLYIGLLQRSKCSRALTFENFCKGPDSRRSRHG